MHIKPTVGRVVHYHPGPAENIPGCGGDQPLAAVVAYVWSDTCVNLAVFDANGNPHSRTSVYLVQDDMPTPGAQYAEWMPYQKGQAAKTEQMDHVISGAALPGVGLGLSSAQGGPGENGCMPASAATP